MRNVVWRPSASMAVALAALVVSASGTAAAASGLLNGDKLIKKGSLSGNRLRRHTLTGTQINLNKLGKVPNAATADRATTANTANVAANAANAVSANTANDAGHAASADKIGDVVYVSAPFTGLVTTRTTGSAACPAGTFVTGGGLTSPSETAYGSDYLVDSHPTANRAGWQVTVENETSTALAETVWAVCVPAASSSG